MVRHIAVEAQQWGPTGAEGAERGQRDEDPDCDINAYFPIKK